jgi:Carboxypeptidase regulatory-like domain
MVRLPIFLSFCTIGLLLPSTSDAFQRGISDAPVNSTRSIAGNVYYGDTGRPADHITVQLLNSEGSTYAPATTTASGGFEFRPLHLGSYEISIDVQGYESTHIPAELTFTSLHGLAIYLKPLAENKPPSKSGAVSAHELSMPQKARDLMVSGKKKLYQDKDAQSGLEDFRQAVSIAPNIHMQQKNYAALLQDIDAYVKLDPDSPAGIRAKRLREKVQEKLASENPASPGASNP